MDVKVVGDSSMKEASLLRLDNTKIKTLMSLSPIWGIDNAISKTVEWTKVWADGGDVKDITDRQILEYLDQRGETICFD